VSLATAGEWFRAHEYVAVWAEGIALIAIFIWDRFDSAHERRISRNTERAWILTELDWPKGEKVRVVLGTSSRSGGPNIEITTANVMLKCRNDGNSPAWIDKVYTYAEIVESIEDLLPTSELEKRAAEPPEKLTPLGPVGPGAEISHHFLLMASGHLNRTSTGKNKIFCVYIVVLPAKTRRFSWVKSGPPKQEATWAENHA
jgi:hypothetical protein